MGHYFLNIQYHAQLYCLPRGAISSVSGSAKLVGLLLPPAAALPKSAEWRRPCPDLTKLFA